MKTKMVIGLLAFGLWFFTACEQGTGTKDPVEKAEEQTKETSTLENKTAKILTETASMNMMNMELSKIAEEKAVTEEAQKLAKGLSQEHTEVKQELEALAQRKQITLPTDMSDDDRSKIENVTDNEGIEFDRKFVDEVINVHKDKINEYENLARDSEDPEIREFAINTLPTLRMQLENAERVENQLKEKDGQAGGGTLKGDDTDKGASARGNRRGSRNTDGNI